MTAVKPEQLLRRVFPPMLATLVSEPPPDDHNWAWELKYDGFRAVTAIAGGDLAMWSRNELDLEPRFPRVAQAMAKIKVGEAVFDGEIVAMDEKGVPRFQLLQSGEHPEKIFLFDVLWLEGEDIRRKPYVERRAILEKLLKRRPAGVELATKLDKNGIEALKEVAHDGWEGIIGKRRTSIYEGRRSREWIKVKALNQQELVIIGFNLSTATNKEVGSLHLAVKGDDGELHYAGKVGTGFTTRMRAELMKMLAPDVIDQPPAKDAPRVHAATWVRPRYVAQVAFTEWTHDNRLRHPSFLGLRPDKGVDEVVKEEPEKGGAKAHGREGARAIEKKSAAAPPPRLRASAPPRLVLTHPDRILYPKDKITKQDLANYYEAMSGPLLRALKDRPLSLEHWNQGIDKPSWFHQDLGREAAPWLTTVETPTRYSARSTVKHLIADSVDALRWLAQMSVLTIHMWASRAQSLNEPDWLVFDLDPAKGKGIEQAIDAAIIMRGLLENLELPSVPKTSGKRGIHVFVPLAPGYTHEDANAFACGIAAAVTRAVPTMTVERSLAKRRGRLYLDCMQNAYGKTMVAPYSPRAIDGAPVSAPLKWDEVTKKLDPLKFNLRNMPDRVAKVGDLFEPVLKKGARLPQLQ
jgi:bifunctional non-homologous end joining protein LigD